MMPRGWFGAACGLLVACGEAGGGGSETGGASSSGATTGAATTGDLPGSSGAATTDAPATTGEPNTGTSAAASSGETGGSSGDATTGAPVDPCPNDLTWENFGRPFALNWCTGCHHSELPTAARACAPCDVNFDRHGDFLVFSGLVKLRALDWEMSGATPMPPAALIPEDQLALLREYVECGAPGPDRAGAVAVCPDPGEKDPLCE